MRLYRSWRLHRQLRRWRDANGVEWPDFSGRIFVRGTTSDNLLAWYDAKDWQR
jgi:hypothetical protein